MLTCRHCIIKLRRADINPLPWGCDALAHPFSAPGIVGMLSLLQTNFRTVSLKG